MKRIRVTSPVTASVGYEPKSLTLEIEFKTTRHVLMRAKSLGTYFNQNIRNEGQFDPALIVNRN